MQSKNTGLSEIMETSCDHCQSRFRVTELQLQAAHGKVRCGECDEIFNALTSLKNHERRQPTDFQQSLLGENQDPGPESELSLHEAMYGSERRSFFSLAPLSWFIGILLLGSLGIAQAIYYQRYQLIQDPRYQQQVINLCQLLPCAERDFASVEQIQLLERNVFTHPVTSDALMVTGSFINQAPFTQKMPGLLISLFDVHGKLIANRRFKSSEYLLENRNRSVVESEAPIQFRLEIVDPGTDALTYEFEFL